MNGPVILVGFMGTGKSQAGRLLAQRLGWEFHDLDAEIAQQAGCSIPDIFATEGEAGFRERERKALCASLERTDWVISCGGGVVARPDNMRMLLRHPWVFRLRATPETIFGRVGGDPNRPLLHGKGNPVDRIRHLLAEREPLYAQFTRQVDTDGFRPSEVALHIASDLRNASS